MIKKKIIAIILVATMLFAVIPMAAFATDSDNVIEIANFQELKDNLNSKEGATLKLTSNINLEEKITISNTVTIDGNGNTISGKNDDPSVNIEIKGGTVTIKNTIITQFGGEAPTTGQLGVIKVTEDAVNPVLNVDNVTIKDFNRAGIDIRAGQFTITNTSIDCKNTRADNEESSILAKGILVGSGVKDGVTGTIQNVNVINSKSTYTEWASSGIEVWGGATVTINKCTITDTENGIAVNNTYDQCGNIDVTIQDTIVNATNRAIRLSGKVDGTAKANVRVLSGNYTGNVVFKDKTDNETLTLCGGTYTGEIEKDNLANLDEYMLEENGEGSYIARVNNEELKTLVLNYEAESLLKEDYTTESYNNFETALSNSKTVLDNINATKEDIQNAQTALKNAYENLVKLTKVESDSNLGIIADEAVSDILNNNETVQNAIKNNPGVEVKTVIEVQDINESEIQEEEKSAIEEVAKNATIAKAFDISILVKDADKNTELDKVEELGEKIKFTITLDEELKNVPEGYERTYQIIRVHNGIAEVLETTLSSDKNAIEFSTDKFSTYVISYVDTKIAEQPSDDENKPEEELPIEDENKPVEEQPTEGTNNNEEKTEEDSEIVQTGDYVLIAIGIIAIVIVANVVYSLKKNKK